MKNLKIKDIDMFKLFKDILISSIKTEDILRYNLYHKKYDRICNIFFPYYRVLHINSEYYIEFHILCVVVNEIKMRVNIFKSFYLFCLYKKIKDDRLKIINLEVEIDKSLENSQAYDEVIDSLKFGKFKVNK